ncbi:MAG TPA: hypothetical protein VFT57_04385 [Gemmatimonadaceae bacterium]|nr:hypothetical protein [Gemmatimonadaceae bacterium]
MAPNADRVLKRRALPLDQTVRWLPLHDAYYLLAEVMTSARALPLVVMQEVLLQVEMHASSEVYGSTCGVLCGAHYRDPGSGAGYILVEGIERATRVYRDADPEASLAVDISRAIDAAERAGRTVVGWYRFDVALFPRLPVADAGMHRALFPEPWQVALLRDGADGEGSGVFMRVEPTEGRAFPIPFFELIPKKRARGRGPKRTSVQWRNYNAESEVVPLPMEAYRSPAPRRAKRSKTNGAPASAPRVGIFSRLGARLSATKQERPSFPHRQVERVATVDAAPPPKVEPAPPPAESWTPPEVAEAPRAPALDERQAETPEAVKPQETAKPRETAKPPEAVEPPPPATVEIPEDLPGAYEEPLRPRPPTGSEYQTPSDELEALFTEWRPDAAGRAASRRIGSPRSWSVPASVVKRAIAAALIIGAGYVGVQRIRAERASRQSVATGAVAAQQDRTEEVATGRLAEAADRRPADGGFSPAERAEVRSALASISDSRAVLVAHLDTLSSTLGGSANDSSASERCTRAGTLYQSSLDDIARIDLARQKLTSLVGPMRMAGVDSLSTITSDLHQRLREICPQ